MFTFDEKHFPRLSFIKIAAGRYGPRHVLSISEGKFFKQPMRQQVAPFRGPVGERHELR
jgi:hypothetical protein